MNNCEEIIRSKLAVVEKAESIRIVYACESGSRAWGFASHNSDYDVRFIYVRPLAWYLSIEPQRDVVEKGLDGNLDLSGWDLKKALRLLRKSNPPLLEWLQSPIVYLERYSIKKKICAHLKDLYSPMSCLYHYLHMAQGNFREYLRGDIVWIKKYFYVLRPVLACHWIEKGLGVVPTELRALVDRVLPDGEVKAEIEKLITLKKNGAELDRGSRNVILHEFLEREIKRIEAISLPHGSTDKKAVNLDELFREAIDEVWASR